MHFISDIARPPSAYSALFAGFFTFFEEKGEKTGEKT